MSVWIPERLLAAILVFSLVWFLPVPEGTAAGVNGSHEGNVSATPDSHHHRSHRDVSSQDGVSSRSYSLFMHRTTGYLVLIIGILFAVDRSTHSQSNRLRYAIGAMWTLFGLFIFVRADPDDWPLGSEFWVSWTMPTHLEWLQHKLLSLIPLMLALYTFRGPAMKHGTWGSPITVGLAVVGAIGLLSHQHGAHPGQNTVDLQHGFFAGTCLLVAFSLLQEARGRWIGNRKQFIFPALLIVLALQLAWYTE
ncbi:MAG: hypothetical protein AB7P24_12255 [Nitrospira sp.]